MHMIAAAKSLQSCPTLCDPTDGSHQAPPPLGFSRQEHWSGLPFPSPICESEVTQSCATLRDPMDCRPTRLLRPWDFLGKSIGVACHCLLHYRFHTNGYIPLASPVGSTFKMFLEADMWNFPGNPVAKTLCPQCRGPSFNP